MFLNSSATTWSDQILKQMRYEEKIKRQEENRIWRERERKERKIEPVVGATSLHLYSSLFLTFLHYLQLHKFSSSKMNLPIQRLWYDARISSSIFQVESPEMRSHNTFTMEILLPRSCFTCESKILIGFTSNNNFFFDLDGIRLQNVTRIRYILSQLGYMENIVNVS